MRILGLTIVAFSLAVVASVRPSVAQSQLGQAYSAGQPSSWEMADNSALIRQELAKMRMQERNFGCRRLIFRSQSRSCRNIRARISALLRQLRGGGSAGVRSYSSVRTICVRVCDGYYYTMSHTNSRKRISQDAEKCVGQYPPGDAVLFYHPFPSDDVSRARTLDGKLYADQAYAFAFRKAYIPSCAAQLQQGLAALKSRVFAAVPSLLEEQSDVPLDDSPTTEVVPVSRARPHGSVDPETLANRAGDFTPSPIDPSTADSLRIVGDPYYFAEANPGPPPTVPGYVRPELKDFRVKQQASALDATRKTPGGRSRDVPSDGPY